MGQHARRLVDQQVERGLATVVPCAADPGHGRQRAEHSRLGSRGHRRLLRIDRRGDREAGLAFDLRIGAPARGPAADHGVRRLVPELAA